MPFKSQAQRRKFYALKARGEMSQKTIDEWQSKTPKNLPERVKQASLDRITYLAFQNELEKIAQGGLVKTMITPVKTLVQKAIGGAAHAAPAAEQAVAHAAPAAEQVAGRAARTVQRAGEAAKDFSLAGEKAIAGASPSAIKSTGGVASAGNIQKTLQEADRVQRAQRWTAAAREARVNKALQEGVLDPKVHSVGEFMRTGQVTPKKIVSAPIPRPEATATGVSTLPETVVGKHKALTGAAPAMPGAAPTMPGGMPAMPGAAPAAPVQAGQGAWFRDPRFVGGGLGLGGLGFGTGALAAG